MNGVDVEIALLGRFEVAVSGERIPDRSWSRRHAAALVKLLALAPGRRLHREQVIDLLWPDSLVDTAMPKLHKATHFARRAIGRDDAVVLRDNTLALFPHVDIAADAVAFEQHARAALSREDVEAAQRALDGYRGELLPDDRYEDWATERREHLAMLHRELLRLTGRWAALVALDPSDEEAHLELMRAQAARGRRSAALRQFARMERALRRDLGVAPSAEAARLRDDLLAESPADRPTRFASCPRRFARGRHEASEPLSPALPR